ncbi:MAG: eukaryotic-like serine/threonine-protein kinase [Blastocatellia bacterium]|jgi:outer membrane protein assembly factor BamB|nr:eukaryotic-like serine/threonine-protein kinase [Blastocatellia bacterium]
MTIASQQSGCQLIKLLFFLLLLVQASSSSLPSRLQAEAANQIELSQPLTLRWEFRSEDTINLTPATDGVRIYLPLSAGSLVSLRVDDGQLIWKMDIGGDLSSSPIADEQAVYVASEARLDESKTPRATGALRALGREGGITQWMRTLPKPVRGALAMNQNTLFGGASDGRVYAIKKSSGEVLWLAQFPAALNSQPTVIGSRLYLGSEDGTLFALDQGTGKTLWRYRTRGAIKGSVAAAEGMLFFGSADGYVYAVNESNGRLRWRTRTGAAVQAVAIARNVLLATSLDNFVYCLSLPKGARLWKHQLAGRIPSQPLTANDGALFIPLSGEAGVVLDLRDGKQINLIPLGEEASVAASPIAAGKLLFVTTRHGLLAFSRPN